MVVALALFFVTSAMVFWALLLCFRAKKKIDPQLQFQFRVVDIWASAIGIAPSMYMLVKLFESSSYDGHEILWWASSIGLPLQCGGCVYGIMSNETLGESSRERPFHAVINIVGGAIVALGLIPILGIAWAIIFSILYEYGWSTLTTGLVFTIFLVYGISKLSNYLAFKSKTQENTTSSAPSPSSPLASPSDGPLGG